MKKILLLLVLMLTFASCGTPKGINVTCYQWEVTLKNGDYASGITLTEQEGRKNIKEFANSRKAKVKRDKIKPITKRFK
jgi:uncharacterized protein YcfL